MTTDTPPSALAAEADLDALVAELRGLDVDEERAADAIDELRAQLAEARAERDRLVERAKRTPQFLHYPDVPEVVALRAQVAALLAEREEARKLLDQAHRTECPTCRDDGTCVGCIVGDFLGVSDDARAALDKAARTATKETPDYEKRVHLETGVGRPAKVVRAAPPTDKGEG